MCASTPGRSRGRNAGSTPAPAPRSGDVFRAAGAALSSQSARNSCDLPFGVRFDVQHSLLPSGEKTGRPSKPSVKVTRTGSRSPAASTMNSSKLAKPSLFAVKTRYWPEG